MAAKKVANNFEKAFKSAIQKMGMQMWNKINREQDTRKFSKHTPKAGTEQIKKLIDQKKPVGTMISELKMRNSKR